jgi:hypothetical protein
MKPRIITALIVFFGSYLPLSVILLVLNFDSTVAKQGLCLKLLETECSLPLKTPVLSIGIFLLCLVCFVLTIFIIRLVRAHDHPVIIEESKHIPSELMSYVLPYVVSFMTIDYQDTSKLIGILIFLLWMFWVTFKSEQIIMNPMLTVLGWKLYDVKFKHQNDDQSYQGKLLSKYEVQPQATTEIGRFQDTMIVKRKKLEAEL